ncbi:hypothetical protein QQY66_48050 [Streptomyces sp. DG2A-72]|uniref:hypothetical protein n=1 Tax=Streptomyces sp. DG2A-72 TaxID=3051386 RepID=UPI00265C5FAD|nr:hypothetical protein [Streptomyces sp. DG2A-72]MDO0939088.1 hypothetical protein [Streptomyces sp. DG2A-72]
MAGRIPAWAGGMVAGVGCLSLAVYLAAIDLETASQVSGVLGLFASIAGVGVSVVSARRERSAETGGGQSIRGSAVGGGVIQVSGTNGKVRIVHRGPAGPPPSVPSSASAPAELGRQSVTGSNVAGPVDQVENAAGSVEIEQGP